LKSLADARHRLLFSPCLDPKFPSQNAELIFQPLLRIHRSAEMHHIIEEEPTLYRNVWSFYYVFKSQKFGNVFFKKGKWKALKK